MIKVLHVLIMDSICKITNRAKTQTKRVRKDVYLNGGEEGVGGEDERRKKRERGRPRSRREWLDNGYEGWRRQHMAARGGQSREIYRKGPYPKMMLLQQARLHTRAPLHHVWHHDNRKCTQRGSRREKEEGGKKGKLKTAFTTRLGLGCSP